MACRKLYDFAVADSRKMQPIVEYVDAPTEKLGASVTQVSTNIVVVDRLWTKPRIVKYELPSLDPVTS
jgi:hypothetical protein